MVSNSGDFTRQRWHAKRREIEDDMESVRSRLEIIVPKDENDMSLWKMYYVERVKLLENPSLHAVAKLLCTNCDKKAEIVNEFFDVLDALQLNVDAESDLHMLEVEAENMVNLEARRLRSEQPQFFDVR